MGLGVGFKQVMVANIRFSGNSRKRLIKSILHEQNAASTKRVGRKPLPELYHFSILRCHEV